MKFDFNALWYITLAIYTYSLFLSISLSRSNVLTKKYLYPMISIIISVVAFYVALIVYDIKGTEIAIAIASIIRLQTGIIITYILREIRRGK